MITVIKADQRHVQGIARVCSESYRVTYKDLYSPEYIEQVIQDYYQPERIQHEIGPENRVWGGYFVALDGEQVVGAAGGGMIDRTVGELFVLYLEPTRRNQGIGSLLLAAVTEQQKRFGATTQWVSVQKDNLLAIPFYERRGFVYQSEQVNNVCLLNEEYIALRYCRSLV